MEEFRYSTEAPTSAQIVRASSSVSSSLMDGSAGMAKPAPGFSKNSSPALNGALAYSSALTICIAMTSACKESAP